MRTTNGFKAIGLFAAALLALAVVWVGGAPGAVAQSARAAPFAHARSDVPADPAVRYGVLPNGLRYAIMRNTQPAGIASIRLRIGAGSLNETDAEQGIAHFLEHMVFNGSQNVPEGEMVRLLQRYGLAFGPDTNAYTSFGETVYMLDLPEVDAETVDKGLFIMRESADRLTLSAAAIDRERGVVLSEERTRDSPELRQFRAQFSVLLPGQLAPRRLPIGTREAISSFTRDQFVSFYQRHYRPENAFLVIVGDIDAASIEGKITALFADWRQPGAAAPAPALGRVARRGLTAGHFVDPNAPVSASVTFVRPPELARDTRAQRARDTVLGLGYAVVNRRLQTIARGATPPFVSASVSRSEFERSATLVGFDVSTRPGAWAEGLAAAEQEVRRALEFGVTQAELDREIAEGRAALEAAAAGAATRDTRALAGQIVNALNEDDVFTAPAEQLAQFRAATDGLRATAVNTALRRDMRGQGPVVFVSERAAIPGGDAAILAAYRASRATPVTAPAAQDVQAFPYASFGAPGTVASESRNAAQDVDLITFANGVRLTFKRTTFQAGRIAVGVRLAGGYAALPNGKPGLALLAPFALNEAGLGRLTAEDLERATAGKVVGLSYGVGDTSMTVSGATRPEDLRLQLQLLTAAVSDPAWRGQGLQRLQAAAENFIRQNDSSPDRVLGRDSPALLRSGDDRWAFPDLAQVRALTMQDLEASFGPMLTQSPIEVTVVGDADRAAVVAAVAETLGALPSRSPRPAPAVALRFPTAPADGQPVRLTHSGRADQSVATIAWPSVDFSDPRRARAVRLMRSVFENRLVEEFRENQGATYSPFTTEELSDTFAGFGYVAAGVEVSPDKIEPFFATVRQITAEMREGRFDDDAIARARRPLVERLQTNERQNAYWSAVLADAQSNPRRFDLMATRISDVEALTKEELVAAARATFQDARAVRLVITARPAATP